LDSAVAEGAGVEAVVGVDGGVLAVVAGSCVSRISSGGV
jgi:hypothetical protein